jgi:hypothetical protein
MFMEKTEDPGAIETSFNVRLYSRSSLLSLFGICKMGRVYFSIGSILFGGTKMVSINLMNREHCVPEVFG